MRSSITATLIINICTVVVHLGIAAAYRTSKISKGEKSKEIMASHHHSLGTANAHCCASCAGFLLYLLFFLQVAAFSDQLLSVPARRSAVYVSSTNLNDWRQAIVGSSGEWQPGPGNTMTAAPSSSLPLAGSLYAGILLAFLLVMLFVSIYAAFMATPEGESCYLFLEPRFLIIFNGMLVMLAGYSVRSVYGFCFCSGSGAAACWPPAVLCVLFSLFCLAVCWLDMLIGLLLPARLFQLCKFGVLLVFCLVAPLASVIISEVPTMFKIVSWILGICSVGIVSLDYLLYYYHAGSESTEKPLMPAAAAVMPAIGNSEEGPAPPGAIPAQLPPEPVASSRQFSNSTSTWLLAGNFQNNNKAAHKPHFL